MPCFNLKGQLMFKITCNVATQTNIFYLATVNQGDIEKVASVLANNLSFDDKHTQPVVSSIDKTDTPGTPLFEYLGVETLSLEPEKELNHRTSLHQQGFLTGAIYNIKEKSTSLYKFKVVKD